MDIDRYNSIIISPNQNIGIGNGINNNRRDNYQIIFSTILYVYIIPLILFFLLQKNTNNFEKSFQINNHEIFNLKEDKDKINNNNDIIIDINDITKISSKMRKLDSNNNIIIKVEHQLDKNRNETNLEEVIKKYIDMILEKLGKSFESSGNLTSENTNNYSKGSFYSEQERQYFISRLNYNNYKGTWEYYPFTPYNTPNEEHFEEFYKYNFTQTNALYYFTSTKYPFKVGKETNGTAYVSFKKVYHRSSKEDHLEIKVKNLEGKYIDNWIIHFSYSKLSNLKRIIDEKRKKFYFRGEFQTILSKGKVLSNQNSLRNDKNCPTLIEVEFPLSQVAIYIVNINKTTPVKIIPTINSNNFSMVISSQCGFRMKIKGEKYNQGEELNSTTIKNELKKYFLMNLIISFLNFFSSTCTSCGLSKHQDTISTFCVISISLNIVWHSYRTLSDINLALNFYQFFGPLMLMSVLPLVNFIIFDLRMLLLYWKINKRILPNRQFIILRLRFFLIFYFLIFCSFFLVGSFYFDQILICLSAIFLWTPQIIHNIITYNKYNYPLIYILSITLDRLFAPFYFRGCDKNFLNIRTDKNLLISVSGFILLTIFILYLQVFLGPRFMLNKKYKKVEIDFYRSKAELLKEKPDSTSEECVICLCPIFSNEINNKINNSQNDINDINYNKIDNNIMENKSGNESIQNNDDILDSNQSDRKKEDNKNILEIANKKKSKTHKKMKIYENKVNPIIINYAFLNQKPKYKKKSQDKQCFYVKIFFVIKVMFWDNLLFFYKYSKNLKNKKYMLLKCGHVFHTACIEKWLEMKKECPSCRSSMQSYI